VRAPAQDRLPRGAAVQRKREETLSFSDRTLVCRDCGREFTFTAGEQEFYASKGLTNDPVRCSTCRAARKAAQARASFDQPEDTGYVRYGSFASFSGRVPRQMHPATCAECGEMTEVPFVPRGDRPVYCSSCYNKIRAPRT
jgi:CxxC-x17-CxxC domain-containing protein